MKKQKKPGRRLDFEALWLGLGVGALCGGLGVLLLWALDTAPEGEPPERFALTTTQRIARMLPDGVQETIAFGLGVLFVLFGGLMILCGLWGWVKGLFVRS